MEQANSAPLNVEGGVMLIPQRSAVSKENMISLLDASQHSENIASMELAPEEYPSLMLANQVVGTILTTAIPAIATTAATIASTAINEQNRIFDEQVLGGFLDKNYVEFPGGKGCDLAEVDKAIENLRKLIQALQDLEPEIASSGSAPGFDTRTTSQKIWIPTQRASPYEVLVGLNSTRTNVVPQISPSCALKYFIDIEKAWVERRNYIQESLFQHGSEDQFCSCFRQWDHSTVDVLFTIANQSLEQAMVRESSACVTSRLLKNGLLTESSWDNLYSAENCRQNCLRYYKSTPLRIIQGRDDYVHSLAWMASQAQHSVDLATCYVFYNDPAQRYVFLDLLTHTALKGVQVRVNIDLLTVESSIVKSAFRAKHGEHKKDGYKARSNVSHPCSFLDNLPPGCPSMSCRSKEQFKSALDFLQEVIHRAAAIPDKKYQVRFWCARDNQDGYRIKNHSKCAVFDAKTDEAIAFIGGSNVVPTCESGDADCDMIVSGQVAKEIGDTFDRLWDCLETEVNLEDCEQKCSSYKEEKKEDTTAGLLSHQSWSDPNASVALLRSEPSSSGNDVILRHVLGAIAKAEKYVYMVMGHCNFPKPLAIALNEACKQGVEVKLLVNSLYSSDLRVNQRDMFQSIQQLLQIAPDVEVWTTAMPSIRQDHPTSDITGRTVKTADAAPPFLHAKFTVIDGIWSAVGSWNVWTRSAFHEIEHELFIKSMLVAEALTAKFEKDRKSTSIRLVKADECMPGAGWCPSGCQLCQQYGPFYVNV